MKTLSICIPSYNRFEHLANTLEKILICQSDDYEIVIIDNCSPRPIEEFIPDDSHIRIIKRENPVYGAKNVGDAVSFASARFALLLLDKDTIDGCHLLDFLTVLRNNWDITGGYCKLNSVKNEYQVSREMDVKTFGYLSKHPSGDFYQISLLRGYINEKNRQLERDPFPFDIYLAYCASKGCMLMYDKPLVYSSLNNPTEKDSGTLTFKKSLDNIYYFPNNRINEFKVYADCLSELDIPQNEKIIVLLRLYKDTIYNVTVGLRQTMKNKTVCKHYGHNPENVTLFQMIKHAKGVRNALLSLDYYSDAEKRTILYRFKRMIVQKIARKVVGEQHG